MDNSDLEVLYSYIETALWSSVDGDDEPLDANYSREDIHPDSFAKMKADVEKFLRDNEDNLRTWNGPTSWKTQAGHDFWLTRNGHGCGFWESEWGDFGDSLTIAAREFRGCDLYVGDDGKIHIL